jgi:predicted RNase H-like nuclease (RuvC/YqgF family)
MEKFIDVKLNVLDIIRSLTFEEAVEVVELIDDHFCDERFPLAVAKLLDDWTKQSPELIPQIEKHLRKDKTEAELREERDRLQQNVQELAKELEKVREGNKGLKAEILQNQLSASKLEAKLGIKDGSPHD